MPMLFSRSVGSYWKGRRIACLTALACALGMGTLASSASAAPSTFISFETGPSNGGGVSAFRPTQGATDDLKLLRGGAVIGEDMGPSSEGRFVSVPNNGPLQAGDVAQFSENGSPVTSVTYDGTPTINGDACNGATGFTGTRNPSASINDVGAFTPSGNSGSNNNPGRVTSLSGSSYGASLAHALATGDIAFVDQSNVTDGGATAVDSFFNQTVPASCPTTGGGGGGGTTTTGTTTAGAATTTTNNTTTNNTTTVLTAPPTAAQILAALQAGEARYITFLVNTYTTGGLARQRVLRIAFSLLEAGKITVTLTSGGAAGASAAKRVVIASGSVSGGAGRAVVPAKLTTAGKRLLRKSKRLRIAFTVSFRPASAGSKPVSSQTPFTLTSTKKKAHKKAKKH